MAELPTDDDRLLDALAVALRPAASRGPAEPSMAELAAFRQLVAASADPAARRRRRLRTWVAGLLVGGVVLSGGTAYATNPVAPRPVRSAAFALKLPVESPELTDAKDALDDLEEELHEGRRDKVAAEVEDVREELADLSPSVRAPLEARAASLLAAAAAFLADPLTVEPRDGREEDSGDDSSGRGSGDDGGSDDSRSGSSGGGSGTDDSRGSGSGSSGSGSDDGSGSSGSGSDDDDGGDDGSGSSGSGSDDDDGDDGAAIAP